MIDLNASDYQLTIEQEFELNQMRLAMSQLERSELEALTLELCRQNFVQRNITKKLFKNAIVG
ncbi:MAG: hypothetical protein ACRC62_13050 [Microcoleus sp.]